MADLNNEVINNIFTRRSVRNFSDKAVDIESIKTIIETAEYAPSGMNKQSWKFTAVMNQEIIKELYTTMEKVLGRENYTFYNSQVLIIPSNERESKWGCEDNACALQNIFLSAHSLDIGSYWINQLNGICDHEEIRPILDKLQIPQEHIVYGFAGLGYSSTEPRGKVNKKAIMLL